MHVQRDCLTHATRFGGCHTLDLTQDMLPSHSNRVGIVKCIMATPVVTLTSRRFPAEDVDTGLFLKLT